MRNICIHVLDAAHERFEVFYFLIPFMTSLHPWFARQSCAFTFSPAYTKTSDFKKSRRMTSATFEAERNRTGQKIARTETGSLWERWAFLNADSDITIQTTIFVQLLTHALFQHRLQAIRLPSVDEALLTGEWWKRLLSDRSRKSLWVIYLFLRSER